METTSLVFQLWSKLLKGGYMGECIGDYYKGVIKGHTTADTRSLELRIEGLGFRVCGLGCGILGLGLRV